MRQESDISEHEFVNESVNDGKQFNGILLQMILFQDIKFPPPPPPKQDETVLCDLSRYATSLQFFR